MSGYTKLYSSILHSTVWREANHVRIVWITMLAMCDARGVVEASLPGLTDAARVTMDECRDALERLSAPDQYSRTRDHDGRRVAEVDGGWLVLNRTKYRDSVSYEHERARNAERQRRYRERHSDSSNGVTESNGVTQRYVTPSNAPSRLVTPAEQSRDKEEKRRDGEPRKRGPVKGPRPADWRPDDRCRAIAQEWNLDLSLEVQSFLAWTDAGGYRYADWNAAFRNHLARARSRQAEQELNRQARFSLASHEQAKAEARKDADRPALPRSVPLPALPRPEAGPAVPPPPGLLAAIRGAARTVPVADPGESRREGQDPCSP